MLEKKYDHLLVEKDKYETGKYYKVMKTKTKIYDVLD